MRKAILCAIKLENYSGDFQHAIDECKNLCQACDIQIEEVLIQNARSIDPKTGFRKGKVDELKKAIEDRSAQLVVFYNNLNFGILSRLEQELGLECIDRTTVILDIFALRAVSRAAKIQTEIARLQYNLPKLLAVEVDFDRSRGGDVISRGSGESKAKIVKRKIEHDLAMLRNELKDYQTHTVVQASKRNKSGMKKVALIGYTNAGKSSLMNCILNHKAKEDKVVLAKDMLFATLDTSVRKLEHNNRHFYLFDTVGFVSDLPHDLIDAFQTTLSAAKEADLLVHVIDASSPLQHQQAQITLDTLKQIEADQVPILTVYNKSDLLDKLDENQLYVSTKSKHNIEYLLDQIVSALYPDTITIECLLPFDKYYLLDKFKHLLNYTILETTEVGTKLEVSGQKQDLHAFYNYQL